MASAPPRRRAPGMPHACCADAPPLRWGRLPLIAVAILLLGTGCQSTHRRLTIDSQPRGALVEVDGEQIGYTPASISYDYYATRRITLIKDGFEQESFLLPVEAPWWQLPPQEFIADNFLPRQVEDRRLVMRTLKPKVIAPTEDVLIRADQLRGRSQTEQ
ncbi:PEGA domain-containing protein [Alienimonas chondri]|uniref:PEGA domain-containing protein n=1 Tax=Alienimonas chondri TaxID=2681879 RepID=A0ABX1VEQ3_9PLAN|nr:PEGA domain-containing protein [Alienimonas chondri]NNJ25531.1 hypothetical protein [Alienimonas chondri]